jgi:hypothetical protein
VYETTGASYRQISPYKSQLFRSLSVCFPLVFGIRDARPRPSLTLYSTVVATKLNGTHVPCTCVQMEEGCEVATADEVATVVHQIFAYAAGACC